MWLPGYVEDDVEVDAVEPDEPDEVLDDEESLELVDGVEGVESDFEVDSDVAEALDDDFDDPPDRLSVL